MGNNWHVAAIAIVLLVMPFALANPVNTTACGTLDADFTLTGNTALTAGTCYTIGASNIVLNCANFMIAFRASATGYGIYNPGGFHNVTVKNCVISQWTADAAARGINFLNTNNNTIFNTTVLVNGTAAYFSNSSYNSVNTSTFKSTGLNGLEGNMLSYSNFSNVTLWGGAAASTYGAYLHDSSTNNLVNASKINVTAGGDSAVYIQNYADNNVIQNSLIAASSTNYAVNIYSSAGTQVLYNNLTGINAGGVQIDCQGMGDNSRIVGNLMNNTGSAGNNGIALQNTCNNETVTFNNLSYYNYGIYTYLYVQFNNISFNNVTSRNSYGIYLTSNTRSNDISWNNVSGTYGIYLNGDCSSNNFYWNNVTGRAGTGIYGQTYTSSNSIINNTINATGGQGVQFITTATNNRIDSNNITSSAIGIYFDSSCNSGVVTNNNVSSTTSYGTYLAGSSNVTYYNNFMTAYTIAAYLSASTSNNFTGNYLRSRTQHGIYITSDANYNSFTDNSMETGNAAGYYGLYMYSSKFNNFFSNRITSNDTAGDSAVWLTNSANNNNFTSNNITGTATNAEGITITTTSVNNSFLRNNIISFGTNYGLVITGNSDDNQFDENNITANRSTAVAITSNAKSNDFRNNAIRANTSAGVAGYGVYIDTSNENTFTNNTIYGNSSYGLYLNSYAQLNTFSGGSIVSNASYGAMLNNNVNNNTFSNITIASNTSYGIRLSTSSQNNKFSFINITSVQWALYLDAVSNSNQFNDSVFYSNTSAVYLSASTYNMFRRVNITAGLNANNYGIQFASNANFNQFNDSTLTALAPTGGYDVYSTASKNLFLNVTFAVTPDAYSTYFADAVSMLNVSYYLQVNAKASNEMPLEGVNISINNKFDTTVARNLFTNETGSTPPTPVLAYMQTQAGSTLYYPYVANAVLTSSTGQSGSTNILSNTQASVYLDATTCGTVNSDLTLKNNVYSEGTCFTTWASGITIDCAGYSINYSRTQKGAAVNMTGQSNVALKNCAISQRGNNNQSHAIIWKNGGSNLIENSTIITNQTSTAYAIYLEGSSPNNTLRSTTLNTSSILFNGTGSSLTREWYAQVTALDRTQTGFEGASVTVRDNSNYLWASGQTNSSGRIPRVSLREFFQNSTGKFYYSNYIVNITAGIIHNDTAVNLTQNRDDVALDLDVVTCGSLSASTTLTNNVHAAGTCFNAIMPGITIDCAGYTINYSKAGAGYGISASGKSLLKMRNCNIVQGGAFPDAYGIYLESSNYSQIDNTTITTLGSPAIGMVNAHNTMAVNTTPSVLPVFMDDQSFNFTRYWHAQVNVIGLADEVIPNATISILNAQGANETNGTANENGTFCTLVRQYQLDNGSWTDFAPLTYSATHPETLQTTAVNENTTTNTNMTIRVISAALDITSPEDGRIYFQGQTASIVVNETKGTGWITNVTLNISNDGINGIYAAAETSPNLWTYSYPIDPAMTARTITLTAYGHNGTANVSAVRHFVVTRNVGGGIETPKITYFFANQTYSTLGDRVAINVTSDLDTIHYSTDLNVTYPNGTTVPLTRWYYSGDETSYVYATLYDLDMDQVGTYNLSVLVRDASDQTVAQNISIECLAAKENFSLTGVGAESIQLLDLNSEATIGNATSENGTANMNVTIPPGLYKVRAINENGPNVTVSNVVLNASTGNNLFSYNSPTSVDFSPPTNRRFIRLFNISSPLDYNGVQVAYNYSDEAASLVAEASVEFQHCEVVNNTCTWEPVNFTLNTTTDYIVANTTHMSLWALLEPAFDEPQTIVQTVYSTSSYPVVETKIVEKSVPVPYEVEKTQMVSDHLFEAPADVEVLQNNQTETTVGLYNSGQTTFEAVTLQAETTLGITADLGTASFEKIEPGAAESSKLTIKTDNVPIGAYKVRLTAKTSNYTDSVEVKVNVVRYLTAQKLEAEKQLSFAQKLSAENQECREFDSNLAAARTALDAGEVDTAMKLSSNAINGCKSSLSLISKQGSGAGTGLFLARTSKSGDDYYTYAIIASVGLVAGLAIVMLKRVVTPKKRDDSGELYE